MRFRTKQTARLGTVLVAALAMVSMMAAGAWASHAYIEISIPIDTVIHAPANSRTLLESADVPAEFANHLCEVRAHAENQISTHPGNDLIVQSGDSQVVLADVEAEPGKVIEAEGPLELGDQIDVWLVMGRDRVFSAGIEVVVECFAEETTTTEATTTTEVPPTEETTTTAEVPPTEETTTTAEIAPTEVTSTLAPTTSIEDEVEAIEVLPFTGTRDTQMGLLGLALLAGGTLLVAAARRTED